MPIKSERRGRKKHAYPWERQEGESEPAWQAFKIYRDLGDLRSIHKVARSLSKSPALIKRWSAGNEWRRRSLEYDREQDRIKQAEKKRFLEEQARREVKIGLKMMRISETQLERFEAAKKGKNKKGEKMSAFDARMCAVDGTKLIKSGMGEPETRSALSLEGTTFSDLLKMVRERKKRAAENDGSGD